MTQVQDLLDHHELCTIIAKAAQALDRRRFDDWLDLCTSDVTMVFPVDPANPFISAGKEAFRRQMEVLHQFAFTTHSVGATLSTIEGDRARTETPCIANHFMGRGSARTNLRMGVRYHDSFVRIQSAWRMSRRELAIDWSELVSSPEATIDGRPAD